MTAAAAAAAAPALPSAPLVPLAPNATLQPPLTRRGHGPGLILITPPERSHGDIAPPSAAAATGEEAEAQQTGGDDDTTQQQTLDPAPQKKWAEEGYAVVRVVLGRDRDRDREDSDKPESHSSGGGTGNPAAEEVWSVADVLSRATGALKRLASCDVKDRFVLIVYGEPSDYAAADDFAPRLRAAYESDAADDVVASVTFSPDWALGAAKRPELLHLPTGGGGDARPDAVATNSDTRTLHAYPGVAGASFVIPGAAGYAYGAAGVAHTRSLGFVKKALGGPHFDLEAIWDEHTELEFGARDVARTMATMVDEPYVNHVPTLTGGGGRARLTAFYARHFVHSNPDDTGLELVSRTVGLDRVVDEFVLCMTHDRVVDWLLPGVPPTGKKLRVPFVSVVNIRGDRLYHEHIHWDQATILRQLGLLPEYLPFPYEVPGQSAGKTPGAGFEYRVPAAGMETASKLQDISAVRSNEMFGFRIREGKQ
ncbi:carboxymethylenebutenolidase [Xylariaceae sp. FL0804]|nr:carboxymethylenebutenolidase [Xylariaceae sp. FL0804]